MWLPLCSIFVLFLQPACSQRIRIPGEERISEESGSNFCDSNSQCQTLAACSVLRASVNWRQNARTCGFTTGERRRPMVCCPNQGRRAGPRQRPPTTRRQIIRSPLATPPVMDPDATRIDASTNANCGQSRSARSARLYSDNAAGGEFAEQGAWPWMVAIIMRDKQNVQTPWCTGFLIDIIRVISAAHCFERNRASLYSTRIGHVNISEGATYDVDRVVVHEGYRPGFYYNDIALMTLSRPVDLPNFNPICLPDAELLRNNLVGYVTTVAGWGSERPGGVMSNRLKKLSSIPVVSNSQCDRIFRDRLPYFRSQFPTGISNSIICAGFLEGGKDSCGGDSGGPLMLQDRGRWFAVGIVSYGYVCGRPGFPGGYTRITSYLDWIQQRMRS